MFCHSDRILLNMGMCGRDYIALRIANKVYTTTLCYAFAVHGTRRC
jgi:hypothetical protein